jgi:hypothetical protein
MRLQIDQTPPEYLAAPAGPTDRVIAGASLLEVLVYSDTPAAYSLKRLELRECPACKTAEDLRQRILAEAPGAATATGLEKAIALLKWSANAADYTAMSELTPADFESWPVERAVYDSSTRIWGAFHAEDTPSSSDESFICSASTHLQSITEFPEPM